MELDSCAFHIQWSYTLLSKHSPLPVTLTTAVGLLQRDSSALLKLGRVEIARICFRRLSNASAKVVIFCDGRVAGSFVRHAIPPCLRRTRRIC